MRRRMTAALFTLLGALYMEGLRLFRMLSRDLNAAAAVVEANYAGAWRCSFREMRIFGDRHRVSVRRLFLNLNSFVSCSMFDDFSDKVTIYNRADIA